MTAFAAVRVVACVLGLGIPFGAFCWGTRWIPKRWARTYAGLVLVPFVWLLLGFAVSSSIARPLEEGNWRCLVCGAVEHRTIYDRWILHREFSRDANGIVDTSTFEDWYWREIGVVHEHDWRPIGCHRHPAVDLVGCHLFTGQAYFAAIPLLPDPEIARSMVDRVLKATGEDRLQMIYDVGRDPPHDLFFALAKGRRIGREEFDDAYADWLTSHPVWRPREYR